MARVLDVTNRNRRASRMARWRWPVTHCLCIRWRSKIRGLRRRAEGVEHRHCDWPATDRPRPAWTGVLAHGGSSGKRDRGTRPKADPPIHVDSKILSPGLASFLRVTSRPPRPVLELAT